MFVKLEDHEFSNISKTLNGFIEAMSAKNQSGDYYVKERRAVSEKVMKDIHLGKMAEFLVSRALHNIGYPLLEPDCLVVNKKTWGADLQYSKFGFPDVHVKACCQWTFDYCKDFSWTFQTKDDLFRKSSNDLVALVYLERYNSAQGEIKAILPWDIIKHKLKDPIKKDFVGQKKCLYYKDL